MLAAYAGELIWDKGITNKSLPPPPSFPPPSHSIGGIFFSRTRVRHFGPRIQAPSRKIEPIRAESNGGVFYIFQCSAAGNCCWLARRPRDYDTQKLSPKIDKSADSPSPGPIRDEACRLESLFSTNTQPFVLTNK